MKQVFIVLAILIQFKVGAQIQNLVFEGAGIRGLAYAGAIKELEKQDKLKNIERVGGTSAGAITALLVALGYNSGEISQIINSTSFKKFNDGKFFLIGGIKRLQKYYGWYRGKKFENWLSEKIENKTGNADINFHEFRQKGFTDLYVTGSCLNKQSTVIFSHENYPNMKIKDAVRISMSIPFYFEAIFLDSNGNIVRNPRSSDDFDVMIDGGLMANFPIWIFDSTKYIHVNAKNEFAFNNHTLGFRIDRQDQIQNDSTGKGLAPMPVSNINEYVAAFYNMIIENLNRQSLTHEDWKRTVSISDGKISPRIRKLSKLEIHALIESGSSATEYFLKHQP